MTKSLPENRRSQPKPAKPDSGHEDRTMQIGVDSFAARSDDDSGNAVSPSDRLRQLIERIEHADQVGLDVFGVGEHHRADFLDSAPAVILAAAAARTHRIRLTSAVTVLSAADPVRVFQNFATLDLLSQGRDEMVVGRGSFIESFPLFGLELKDYDSLFTEKLDQYEERGELRRVIGFSLSAVASVMAHIISEPACRATCLALPSGALYVGCSDDIEMRLAQHSSGTACRTTTLDPPTSVRFIELCSDFTVARRREAQIKRWSRLKKEALIAGDAARLRALSKSRD